jgi:hypothetical protein
MMSKYSALIFCGFGLTAAGFLVRLDFDTSWSGSESKVLDYAKISGRSKQLDEERRLHTCFLQRMNHVFDTLARGEISYSQACVGLYDTSLQIYPKFVNNLKMIEGDNTKEKIARVILSHFRMKTEDSACCSPGANRFRELEEEFASTSFQAWCRTPWASQLED